MRADYLSASAICILFSFFTLISCQDGGPSPTQSTVGSTQIYQPPPTVLLTPQTASCIFYDSRDNRSRECSLFPTNSCFSFIRRRTDGTTYIKRGCSVNCQNDNRNRKIQICCHSHLCNNHVLSEANFTTSQPTPALPPPALPPPQCHQSYGNGTCNMTTACYSRLTYMSDGTYQAQQGCVRGSECEERADNTVIQHCCTSNLCNTPIPNPCNIPTATPTFTPSSPSPPSSSEAPPIPSFSPPDIRPELEETDQPYYPNCNCDDCQGSTCRGVRCGTKVVYSDLPVPSVTLMCVNNTQLCTEGGEFDPNPAPGSSDLFCCDSDQCNQRPDFPSLPLDFPILCPTPPATPTPTQAHAPQSTDSQEVTTGAAPATSVVPSSSSDKLYFTFTAVVSVVGGAIVVGVVLVLVILVLRRTRKKSSRRKVSSRQLSPDSDMTARYVHVHITRDSPLSSKSSGSTSSSSSTSTGALLDPEFLKHLGTSV